jgi:hypothetical protein
MRVAHIICSLHHIAHLTHEKNAMKTLSKASPNLLARCVSAVVLVAAGAACHLAAAESTAPAERFVVTVPTSDTFTSDVPVSIEFGKDVVAETVKLRLNGKDLDADVLERANGCGKASRTGSPRGHANTSAMLCPPGVTLLAATLRAGDGLKPGENRLVATAINEDGSLDSKTIAFFSTPPLEGDAHVVGGSLNYTPRSIGLTVTSGGAEPWVKITTGWPAPATPDPDPNIHPYYDTTLPLSTDTACASTDVYQVVVLDRQAPTNEIAYRCFGTDGDFNAYLKTLTSSELVIAGTTYMHNAGSALDTSSIGGTNYGAANMPQPMGYVAIGVGGATPGTAYEDYYEADDALTPFPGYTWVDTNPHATGTLNYDVNANFNFVPAEAQQFSVTPGNPATVQVGSITYGSSALQGSYQNGFFLVVLDRVALRPMFWNNGGWALSSVCRTDPIEDPSGCGMFFPTGEPSAPGSPIQDLTNALNALSPRQLAILTTVGKPLTSGAAVDQAFAAAIARIGGTYYTMQSLGQAGRNFTLVANGPDPAALAKTGNMTSPFAKGVAEASNAFTQQKQSGALTGLFTRNQSGLYYAMQTAQQSSLTPAPATSIDFSFHLMATPPNGDWPMTDTAAHVAAYHYISNQYLSAYPLNMSGAAAYDLRYHYWSLSEAVESNASWFDGTCPAGISTGSFTAADYCDVWNQLKAEMGALTAVRKLFGDNGLRGIFTRNVAPDVIAASYTIHEGEFTVAPTANVGMNAANWLKMAAGIDSLMTLASGPAAPLFAATGSLLNIGSAAYSLMAEKGGDLVQFESSYDVALGQADAYATRLTQNLPSAYDAAADMIYSDWTKLAAVAAKADDTSSGWQITDAVSGDAISDAIATGAQRALYVQIIPQTYQLDVQNAQPVYMISLLGSINYTKQNCSANYANISSEGYDQKWTLGTTGQTASGTWSDDFMVMAGTIDHDEDDDMVEQMPSQTLLDELFADPNGATSGFLDLPKDMVFSSSYLKARKGATYSSIYCYKIPCTWDDRGDGPKACVGP